MDGELATLLSVAGCIEMVAGSDLVLVAGSDLVLVAGCIELEAGSDLVSVAGCIELVAGSDLVSVAGCIELVAGSDLVSVAGCIELVAGSDLVSVAGCIELVAGSDLVSVAGCIELVAGSDLVSVAGCIELVAGSDLVSVELVAGSDLVSVAGCIELVAGSDVSVAGCIELEAGSDLVPGLGGWGFLGEGTVTGGAGLGGTGDLFKGGEARGGGGGEGGGVGVGIEASKLTSSDSSCMELIRESTITSLVPRLEVDSLSLITLSPLTPSQTPPTFPESSSPWVVMATKTTASSSLSAITDSSPNDGSAGMRKASWGAGVENLSDGAPNSSGGSEGAPNSSGGGGKQSVLLLLLFPLQLRAAINSSGVSSSFPVVWFISSIF